MSTTAVQLHGDVYGFTEEQVNVIKATIAPGASNDELALFLMVCQKTGLDPFSRQIYLSERKVKDPKTDQWVKKKTPETTIDGFRVIAERSGQYAGQLGPFWCGEDGIWKDVWLDLQRMPAAAKVGILRHDFKEPVWGIALFEEFKQTKSDGTLNSMWQKMGANQLAKCSESQALRKAFPRDLSGMYSREEMAQAENGKLHETPLQVAERQIADNNQKRIEQGKSPIMEANPRAGEGVKKSFHFTGEFPDMSVGDNSRPLSELEERHAAQIMEANAILDEASEKPAPRKKGSISFKALPAFAEIKKELREAFGDDRQYYDILNLAGVAHADELKAEQSKDTWKLMATTLKKHKDDEALRSDLAAQRVELGGEKFMVILGVHGFESIPDVLSRANGVQIQGLLDELRAQ